MDLYMFLATICECLTYEQVNKLLDTVQDFFNKL